MSPAKSRRNRQLNAPATSSLADTQPYLRRTPRVGAPSMPNHEVERGDAPLDAAAREELIRTAAYLRAEYRGFIPGHELEDWLSAEREIDYWIASRAAPRRYGL